MGPPHTPCDVTHSITAYPCRSSPTCSTPPSTPSTYQIPPALDPPTEPSMVSSFLSLSLPLLLSLCLTLSLSLCLCLCVCVNIVKGKCSSSGLTDLCREGNYCHSDGQSCSHGDDDSDGIMEGGNGSHHVRQTQGNQNLCGESKLKTRCQVPPV